MVPDVASIAGRESQYVVDNLFDKNQKALCTAMDQLITSNDLMRYV